MDLLTRALLIIAGLALVFATIMSAVQTLVVPRSARVWLTRWVFIAVRWVFRLRTDRAETYEERDAIMALYAPIALLSLPVVWLAVIMAAYVPIYAGLGVSTWTEAIALSGSSLFTLGYIQPSTQAVTLTTFSEAGLGLGMVTLLIAYLPTMYSAFGRRETQVTLLEVRAGTPPSAVVLIERFHRLRRLDRLSQLWETWEVWFAEIEESHTSLAALAFFRSPQPDHSWITAAGAVLDGAALTASTLDVPHDPQTDLCIRAGYLSLQRIAEFFQIAYDPLPAPDAPISIARQEFDAAYDQLLASGVPLKADRDQAWRDFAGWRVNYDVVLVQLADMIMAPEAPWSSDRGVLLPARPHRRRR